MYLGPLADRYQLFIAVLELPPATLEQQLPCTFLPYAVSGHWASYGVGYAS